MKIKNAIGILMFALLANNVYADVSVCKYGKVTLPSLSCYGRAELDGTTVTGKVTVFGPLSANRASMGSLEVSGETKLQQSEVNGDTQIRGNAYLAITTIGGALNVNGPCEVTNSNLNGSTDVMGSFTARSSNIKGAVTVFGMLDATDSKFFSPVSVSSNDVNFAASHVAASVTIFDNNSTPYLYLTSASEIEGDVSFHGIAGIVKAGDGSKIDGKIINGHIE